MGAFTKMHGLGNDFVVIDARHQPCPMTPARAAAIAHRTEGIGCDQIILLEPAAHADAFMRIYNADGSEASACGNASRAVALLLGGTRRLDTLGGTITVSAEGQDSAVVDMGRAAHGWEAIPLAFAMDTAHLPLAWDMLRDPAAINVGNPHIVFFVDDVDTVPLATLGPLIETDPLFPERINVNVACVTGLSSLRLRVWERGAGLTRACGTGACASAAVAMARKLVVGPVAVDLPGGRLTIDQRPDGTLIMHGPATTVFTGNADWAIFG